MRFCSGEFGLLFSLLPGYLKVVTMSQPRVPAEKKTRNPELTQQRLLKAATKLFAEKGFDGVSVDDIVASAEINKRMVYHYFGDKEGLYVAVLKQVFSRLSDVELKTLDDISDPAGTIRKILQTYFAFLNENPEFVALLSWENLYRGRFIAANPGVLSKSPVLKRLEEFLREGVAQGVIHPGVNVKHLLISLISLCFVYHANRYTLSQSVGLNLESPKILKEGLEHAIDLTLHGLLVRSPESR